MALADGRFWIVDVEGNGARPPEIVSLALVEVSNLALTGRRRHWLIRPVQPIAPIVSRIHGLRDTDVADAPSMDDVADDVFIWLHDASIVGHNVRVDLDAISRSVPDWMPRRAIDTLPLARSLRPGLGSYGLEKLGAALGHVNEAARISGKRRHSAIYDAVLTALVFIDLVSGLAPERRDATLEHADVLRSGQGRLV